MPDGHVKWYDDQAGEGVIEHLGRDHPVRATDIAKEARVPGAPVTFDIVREGGRRDPMRRAVNAQLREGTRVSRRQSRFGDLTGAKRRRDKRPRRNRPPNDATSPPPDER